jgi:hypothetical protein
MRNWETTAGVKFTPRPHDRECSNEVRGVSLAQHVPNFVAPAPRHEQVRHMLGDALCELCVSEELVHGCFKRAHVGMGRTPAKFANRTTDLLAEHDFDAHDLGAQLSDFQAPLLGHEQSNKRSVCVHRARMQGR